MREVVIVEAVRTPVGRRGGGLAGIHPVDLSAHVLNALVERAGIDPDLVRDVIWGCVSQTGEQAVNIARNAVLAAGWPETVPGVTIDRQCGSSQQAVHFAAAGVAAGHYDVVVAGGVESMSRVPMLCTITQGPGEPFGERIRERYQDWMFNQGISAEMLAQRWKITREQADELALASHERATAAIDSGAFEAEIASLAGVSTDEGVRRDTSMAALAGLRPAFTPDGLVTAGNSSQISDGAAALLITSVDAAHRLGLNPLVRFEAFEVSGVDPITMLTGPIPATAAVLERAGLRIDDIDVFEVNEAFATVVAAWQAETGANPKFVNQLGGAIALGHPLGASGARIMTTLVHHMRTTGARYGLQVMCEGGGMANATILEAA